MNPKIDYETSEKWADVVPIPQNEGGPQPLAAIFYPDDYRQAMEYLRAVMAANEASERVLELTEHIISINPAHYTVWLYRASVLKRLDSDPHDELTWLNKISLRHLKNYQIWHHREVIMSRVQSPQPPEDELPFLSKMLSKDVKNYHVWSYRHWLVRHFNLWPSLTDPEVKNTELELVDTLLKMDVRNNSAWNHRFFCIFGREDGKEVAEAVVEREIKLAKEKIELAPQNLSAWNYLKGVLRKRKDGPNIKEELEEFSVRFANLEDVEGISSSHAMDFLAEIWAEKGEAEKASKALDLLAERLDPVRKNYWNWRKSQIQVEGKA